MQTQDTRLDVDSGEQVGPSKVISEGKVMVNTSFTKRIVLAMSKEIV